MTPAAVLAVRGQRRGRDRTRPRMLQRLIRRRRRRRRRPRWWCATRRTRCATRRTRCATRRTRVIRRSSSVSGQGRPPPTAPRRLTSLHGRLFWTARSTHALGRRSAREKRETRSAPQAILRAATQLEAGRGGAGRTLARDGPAAADGNRWRLEDGRGYWEIYTWTRANL